MPTTAMRDVNNLMTSANTFAQGINYGPETGVVNAYAVALTPAATSYISGMAIEFMATHANTGPSTLNVNGLGVKAITKNGSVLLSGGEIAANQVVRVVYDGTEFQLISVGNLSYLKPSADGTSSVTIRKADGTTNVIIVDTIDGRLGVNVTPTCELDAGPSGAVNAGSYRINGQILATIMASNPQLATGPNFAADTGAVNAYAVALPQIPSYAAGMVILMLAGNANTAASSLSVNGWAPKTITREANQALTGGEIAAGQIVMLVYDGTYFQLVGASSTVYAP